MALISNKLNPFIAHIIMKTSSELRLSARNALRGNWAKSVIATIVYLVVVAIISALTGTDNTNPAKMFSLSGVGLLVSILVAYPLELGFENSFKALYQNGDQNILANIFSIPREHYSHYVWGMFLMQLKIMLWTLLFVIPGIIKSFSYAMTPYLLVEHPEMPVAEAIQTSKRMMNGHKFDLFYLYLTFIGWFLLSIITCGIGFFWLVPYMTTAKAAFYTDLKNTEGIIEATVIG